MCTKTTPTHNYSVTAKFFHPGGDFLKIKRAPPGYFFKYKKSSGSLASVGMATCVRCGVRFANVMQMGAHTRTCARPSVSSAVVDADVASTAVDDADGADFLDVDEVLDADAVDADDTVDDGIVITRPVSSIQSLARRQKKGWGVARPVAFGSRPCRSDAVLSRDFREVSLNKSHTRAFTHVYMSYTYV